MAETRTSTGRFNRLRPRPQERIVRELLKGRRDVPSGVRGPASTDDAAKVALVERAKQSAHGDASDGALPGRPG